MDTKKLATEVTTYFRDFLETNFHQKKNLPKRIIKNQNSKNLLIGINLKNFETLCEQIHQGITNSFTHIIQIKKGVYTQGLDNSNLEIIERYCNSLNEEALKDISQQLDNKAHEIINTHRIDTNDALDSIKEQIKEKIKDEISASFFYPLAHLITPTVSLSMKKKKEDIESESLDELKYGLKETLEDVARALSNEFVYLEIINKKKVNLNICDLITIKSLQDNITRYIKSTHTQDLFLKLNELITNSQILDNQQIYLYLFDIKFENSNFPLFYIPIDLSFENKKPQDTINITFDSQLYVNKKAIDYITRKINKDTEKKGRIKSTDKRIIYLRDEDTHLAKIVEQIINELIRFCEIDSIFNLHSNKIQNIKSDKLPISLSNSCHFALFEKSDEAIVNDYEDLLNILNNPDDKLGQKFCNLLNAFLKEEPVSIVQDIEHNWENTTIAEKLVTTGPIPLNEEQNQILMAIKNYKCKYIVVEGPPGTGKSHTITAMAFHTIMNKQNVLVLSDKTEALDVVENKINDTINKVRVNDDFQNPILRLGKSQNNYRKILSTESQNNIKSHLKHANKNEHHLQNEIEKRNLRLINNICQEAKSYDAIKIKDIIALEKLEQKLEEKSSHDFKQFKNKIIIDEFLSNVPQSIGHLSNFHKTSLYLQSVYHQENISVISIIKDYFEASFTKYNLSVVHKCLNVLNKLKMSNFDISLFQQINNLDMNNLEILTRISNKLIHLPKHPFFGYFFSRKKINSLKIEYEKNFESSSIVNITNQMNEIKKIVQANTFLYKEIRQEKILSENPIFYRKIILNLYPHDSNKLLEESALIISHFDEVEKFVNLYPITSKNINLNYFADIFFHHLQKFLMNISN